jgi:membrane fusion protein (multidrug efflux system)
MLRKLKELIKKHMGGGDRIISSGGSRKIVILIVVLVVGAILVVGAYVFLKATVINVCKIVLREGEGVIAIDRKPVGVEAKKAFLGTSMKQVKSLGVLKAKAEVMIRSEIAAKIKEICFVEGSEIVAGQVLIRFEDDLFVAEKDKAEAELEHAKMEYERTKRLLEQKAGAQKAFDEASARYHMALAEVAAATAKLRKTVIRAPFSGVAGIMKVSVGSVIQANENLVNVVDNSSMGVEFMVSAVYLRDVASGQSVDLAIDAFPDKAFPGRIDAIDSEVDTKNHSILVRAVVPNKAKNLKPGLYANVLVTIGEKSGVLLIDEDALGREGSIEFVWVVDEKNRSYWRRVLTGARTADGVEVLAGLQEGEYVITAGHLKVSDGARVKIMNKEGEGDGSSESKDVDGGASYADGGMDMLSSGVSGFGAG